MSVKMSDFIDIDQWEKLQDAISRMTGVALVLVDYRGKDVSRKSGVHPFCQSARNDPKLSKLCEKCDARGAIEAVRLEKPYHYYCYFDIVDFTIPIIIDQEYLGALLGGQITLKDSREEMEKVLVVDNQAELMEGMEEVYRSIPMITEEKLEKIEELLIQISEYLLSQGLEKNEISKKYHAILNANSLNESLKEKISRNDTMVQNISEGQLQVKDHRLQIMIELIFENPQEMYTLNALSKLMGLSVGHLSRLFQAEFGESFSVFYRKLKINWSKELLIETDKNISDIRKELGYENPSYFIQSFKKVEGMTPLKFRKIQA